MKRILNLKALLALLMAAVSLAGRADVFFTDNFNNGSTTNLLSVPGGTTNNSFTSYDFASTKNTVPSCTLTPGDLKLTLGGATTSGFMEAQAIFATNPVTLNALNDYVDIQVVFTNTTGTLLSAGNTSYLWLGLYFSGGNLPVSGGLLANAGLGTASGSPYAFGNCADWMGFFSRMCENGDNWSLITRPAQNAGATSSANQDLVGDNAGSGTFNNPGGTSLVTSNAPNFTLTTGGVYTMQFRVTLSSLGSDGQAADGVLTLSNALYNGAGEGGTTVFGVSTTNAYGASLLTETFDGLCVGIRSAGTSTTPLMDVSSILITGISTPNTNPPIFTQMPATVTVATNGSCAFFVTAVGPGVTYQWHRNGTNLIDGDNISGSKSDQLTISPAGPADVLSGPNGYYVTATATGVGNNLTTNSVTNYLALVPVTNLVWSGAGTVWNLNSNTYWFDPNNNPAGFNFGDPVIFNDVGFNNSGGLPTVTLNGNYLAAASVTVTGGSPYSFQGTGNFAGPGNLVYNGSGNLTINNANTYTGGTTISNSAADLLLNNINGLGTGPLTLAEGTLEIVPSGSASSGIIGNVNVNGDSTIIYDGTGPNGVVFFGDWSGVSGKTLTIGCGNSTNTLPTRLHLAGNNTMFDANLYLSNNLIVFAAYGSTDVLNGVVSGPAQLMQKGGILLLNGPNTYTGGTIPATGAIGLGIDTTGPAGAPTSGPLGTAPLLLTTDPASSGNTGSGQVFASGGPHTIGNAIQNWSGGTNLTFIIGGSQNLTFTGPMSLNGNDNLYSSSITARTIQVTNQALTTFSGVISDMTNGVSAGYGLIKTGNGILALNATETYTGPTTVSNGTLFVNGSLAAASAVNVNGTNALLGGVGTIGGSVIVTNAAGITAGSNTIGTLTISGSLTLSASSTNIVKVNKAAGSAHDLVTVGGAITYGGTLYATNLAGTITTSDTFQVFNATGAKNLNFASVTGSPGPGLGWTFNPATGTLGVTVVASPLSALRFTSNPVISGNALSISATNTGAGSVYLLTTTNLTTPLSAWTPVWTNVLAGSSSFTTNIAGIVNPTLKNQFYMLGSTNN